MAGCRAADIPLASRPPDWAWRILDHGFGGGRLGGLVDDALQCRANGGVHRCGLVACGIPAALAVPDGGNDDGCGVGSTVVRSASGVVWSGIGVVAPVSTCVPRRR